MWGVVLRVSPGGRELGSGEQLILMPLARDGVADNLVTFRACKVHLIAEFRIERGDEVSALIDDSGVDSLPYDKRWGRYRMRLTGHDLTTHRDLLLDLIKRASGTPAPIED